MSGAEGAKVRKLYRVLGVASSSSDEELKEAYRSAVLKWHPDRHQGAAARSDAEFRFREAQAAYDDITAHRQQHGVPSAGSSGSSAGAYDPLNRQRTQAERAKESYAHDVRSGHRAAGAAAAAAVLALRVLPLCARSICRPGSRTSDRRCHTHTLSLSDTIDVVRRWLGAVDEFEGIDVVGGDGAAPQTVRILQRALARLHRPALRARRFEARVREKVLSARVPRAALRHRGGDTRRRVHPLVVGIWWRDHTPTADHCLQAAVRLW